MTEIVCPGKRLGRAGDFRAGPGTYVRGAYIYASVVGPKVEQADAEGGVEKPYLIVSVFACTFISRLSLCTSAVAGLTLEISGAYYCLCVLSYHSTTRTTVVFCQISVLHDGARLIDTGII